MSQPSPKYIDKIVAWTKGGGEVDLSRMHIPLPGQFRARLALECYQLWIENKTISIRKIVKNIAARDYTTLMQNAELGNQNAQEMVSALGIRRDAATGTVVLRKENEITNDIYVVNQLVGHLAEAKNHIQRAMYEDNIEWLIQFGRKTGNITAMREAQRNLEKINNDFKDEQNPADALKPGVDRHIYGDISIIKPDRKNYTEKELRDFAKKIGANVEDITEMFENEEGVYVEQSDSDDDEPSEAQAQPPSENVPYAAVVPQPDSDEPFNQ